MTDRDLGDFDSYDTGEESNRQDQESDFERPDLDAVPEADGLGVLAVSEGLRVAEDGEDTRIRAYVTADRRQAVRVGSYVLAPFHDDETLFCRVTAVEYAQAFTADDATEIHARRAMQAADVEERDFKFIATLDPQAVLYPDDGALHRRMPDRVPRPETVVRTADDVTAIKTGLNIPEDGVFLGHLAVGGERVQTGVDPVPIDYRLNDDYTGGDPLVFRHTLIAGGTGSGKTHTAKNILRQFLAAARTYPVDTGASRAPQAAVVQFDPQDEYAQMHDDNPAASGDDERAWERQGIAYGGHDQTKAFIPDIQTASYAASHHRAEQVPFSIPFSMVQGNPWLVASSDLNDNQYAALTQLLTRYFEEGGETYDGFVSFLDDPSLREQLDESGRVHEATFNAVYRRVLGVPGEVFDQSAPPITELVDQFIRPGQLTTVPTYHLSNSRAAETVVLAVATLLIDEKLSNDSTYDRIAETPLILGMDEAHNFLTDADSVQARQVIGKFTEAAKQGRKERLGLFLVTQDPQDVADPVFKQINTTIVLNLGDEDAISAVNIPKNLESKVPYMETGQMVVYSPDNSEPVELVGLPTCVTRHGQD